ncbi:MAG TPA: hypothetical protein VN706_05130 [Gemmatimonadaceae bacterium]|nr:hypothetical protein [Gemmatimonadaceae bacterium]
MMDEAFISVTDALALMLDFHGDITDAAAGVRSHIYQCTVELPIELDVSRADDGSLVLGSVPPLYPVSTTYRPSYHRVRFTAVVDEAPHGR